MSELYHHGILGQKWGIRRFQNRDGTLTAAGRRRYGRGGENPVDQFLTRQKEKIQAKRELEALQKEEKRRLYDYKGKTDQELKDAIARKKLENEYVSTVLPKPKEKIVKKLTNRFMEDFGKKAVSEVAVPLATMGAKKITIKALENSKSLDKDTINQVKKLFNLEDEPKEKHFPSWMEERLESMSYDDLSKAYKRENTKAKLKKLLMEKS